MEKNIYRLLLAVGVWVMGWYGLIWIMSRISFEERDHVNQFVYLENLNPFEAAMTVWDGHWYRVLADQGYFFDGKANTYLFAFFPLYPMLLSIIQLIIPPPYSVMVFNLGLLILIAIGLHKLDKSNIALILFGVNPAFIFFLITYSESLFFLLTIVNYYSYRQNKIGLGAISGILATLTRSQGLLLLIPWVFKYICKVLEKKKQKEIKMLIPALGILLAFTSWYLFGSVSNGGLNFFGKIQEAWDRESPSITNLNWIGWRFLNIDKLASHDFHFSKLDVGVMTLTLVVLMIGLINNIVETGWIWFGFMSIALPLLSGSTMSLFRFVAVILPVYIISGKYMNRISGFKELVIGISFSISVLVGFMLINWYWIG